MTMKNMQQQARELKKLFALSRDAVVGVHGDRVLFANAAAERLFGPVTEGQALSSLLSGQLDVPGEDSYVTAAFLGEDRYTVIAARQGEILVLTLLPGRNAAAGLTAGALSRLRSSAFGLQVALDALVRSQDDPELSRRAYHSYYGLVHSIDQLADASALGRDEFLCRKKTLDLAVLVRDMTDSAAALVRDRAVEITCSVPEGPCPVSGDRERLEQMLLILLSNALLHTPAGGRITVGLRPAMGKLILSVDDTGEGMDEEAMAYAFSVRDDLSPAGAVSGAGMGLYIAQGIAHLHGGAIVLLSRPGEGTSVRVTLPAGGQLRLGDCEREPARGSELLLRELSGVLSAQAYDVKFRE